MNRSIDYDEIAKTYDRRYRENRSRLDKTVTSQLGVLTAEEYQRGIHRIRKDLESSEKRGEPLFLETDLRLYATFSRV